ncbi:MAG TPA: hypothetical protein VG675_24875 [Bryobacteraceae bacterium]|nr:hypothetical protein [Bryobacteraceae bacterium]
MAHFIASLNRVHQPAPPIPQRTNINASDDASPSSSSSSANPAADFQALFSSSPAPEPAAAQAPAAAPTAESTFGSNPWMTNPVGVGPNGALFGYNSNYFATPDTAAEVAQMLGGTVVESNEFMSSGSPFVQMQPNEMVQLSNGRVINPGLVASFYTHGYPQSYIDRLLTSEVTGNPA